MICAAALELGSGAGYERDARVPVPAASTIKVLVSAALWTGVERGGIDPDGRVRAGDVPACGGGGLVESMDAETGLTFADLDLLMLAVSDNAAANVLIEMVGMDAVNALAHDLGLEHTVLRRRMMDAAAAERGEENTTCAADLVTLMAALARADGLPARACRRVLAALAQSQHTDIIPRRLPAADRIISCKQGELHSVRHDVGLIEEGGRRVALAVLSAPPADPGALARLAAVAYRHVAVAPDSLTSAASGAS